MKVHSLLTKVEMEEQQASRGRPVRPCPPYSWTFAQSLIEQATKHLQQNGQDGLEQLVLWGGYPTPQGVVISTLFMPDTEATWGWVHILPAEQPHIAEWLYSHGQLLFCETHTHRGEGPGATQISEEDRRHPASRHNGFLTVIVPGYARHGVDFRRAGLWECQGLEWLEMPRQEAISRLHLVGPNVANGNFPAK